MRGVFTNEVWFRTCGHRTVSLSSVVSVRITTRRTSDSSLLQTNPRNQRLPPASRRHASKNLLTLIPHLPALLARRFTITTTLLFRNIRLSKQRSANVSDSTCIREFMWVYQISYSAVICRVCNLPVKRSAVLCDQCSLIAHSKCAHNAPPTCNLRAQLLLYAQYAENGSSPLELLGPMTLSPSNSEGVSTPRTSFDFGQQQTPNPTTPHPPTAFKVLTAFKRSRTSQSPDPATQSTPSVNSIPTPRERRTSLLPPNPLRRKGGDAARSLSSNSTSPGPSSLRTNDTRRSAGARSESIISGGNDAEVARLSKITGYSVISVGSEHHQEETSPTDIPGGLPSSPTTSKGRTSKSGDGCLVQ